MAGTRERWRLDDWMRPARGEHYTPRLTSGELLPVEGPRRSKPARRGAFSSIDGITAKERRSMVWGLLFVVVGYATVSWWLGAARGLSVSAGALFISVVYVVRLYRSRHVGWRTQQAAQTPTAPAP